MAGALSASFKAGQNVTMSNLRSLNEKLREAQKALDSAQGNIENTEDTQDKMDDARNELTEILNVGIWEKMWRGEVSPFEFYGFKYQEDLQHELMAGEPGFPVQNIGQAVSVAPIPRVPVWDPILSMNAHSMNVEKAEHIHVNGQDIVAFTEFALSAILVRSESISSILMQARAVESAMLTLKATIRATQMALSIKKDPEAPAKLAKYLSTQAQFLAISLITAAAIALLNALMNGYIREFGGTTGRGQLLLSAPAFYLNTNWTNYIYLDPLIGTIMSGVVTTTTTTAILLQTFNLLTVTSAVLETLPFPAAKVAAKVMDAIASVIDKTAWVLFVSNYVQLALACSMLGLIVTSRNNGKQIPSLFGGAGNNQEMRLPDSVLGNPLWACLGYLIQFSDEIDGGNAFLTGLQQMHKYMTMGDPTGPYLNQLLAAFNKSIVDLNWAITEMKGNQSRVAKMNPTNNSAFSFKKLEQPVLEDWWGVTYPLIAWDFNDRAGGVIGGGSYPPLDPAVENILDMRATVYPGDYFGTQRGIHYWDGKSVAYTVVIRAKAYLTYSRIWYGFCVLVQFSGNPKLYLLMERDAVYGPMSFSPCTHCEQMIYNFNRKLLPMSAPYTNSRNGMLDYYYATITTPDSETCVQYRNVLGQKENWLSGQLINTEFTFGGDIYITDPPGHGMTEGFINSYADM